MPRYKGSNGEAAEKAAAAEAAEYEDRRADLRLNGWLTRHNGHTWTDKQGFCADRSWVSGR